MSRTSFSNVNWNKLVANASDEDISPLKSANLNKLFKPSAEKSGQPPMFSPLLYAPQRKYAPRSKPATKIAPRSKPALKIAPFSMRPRNSMGRQILQGPKGGKYVVSSVGQRVPYVSNVGSRKGVVNSGKLDSKGRKIYIGPRGGKFVISETGKRINPLM